MKNKCLKLILISFILLVGLSVINVHAAEFDATAGFDVCEKAGIVKIFQIIGYALFIIKIIVPILLIALGSMDLGKAVLSSDEQAIKKATNILIKRAIASVVIFFIPTLLSAVVKLLDGIDKLDDFSCLSGCVSKPSDKTTCKIPTNIIFGDD